MITTELKQQRMLPANIVKRLELLQDFLISKELYEFLVKRKSIISAICNYIEALSREVYAHANIDDEYDDTVSDELLLKAVKCAAYAYIDIQDNGIYELIKTNTK